MIVLDCKQGEKQWLEARRAIPTSSCFSGILTAKGALASGWDGYMNKLLAEYIDPKTSVEERIYTKDMKRGNKLEPEACDEYEFITGNKVEAVGGLYLDENRETLCSPDGLIRKISRGLEIKCPKLSTHIGWIRKDIMPTQHIIQVQTGMVFAGWNEWDFYSYHPSHIPFLKTVKADPILHRAIKKTISYFIAELNKEKSIIDQQKQEF